MRCKIKGENSMREKRGDKKRKKKRKKKCYYQDLNSSANSLSKTNSLNQAHIFFNF